MILISEWESCNLGTTRRPWVRGHEDPGYESFCSHSTSCLFRFLFLFQALLKVGVHGLLLHLVIPSVTRKEKDFVRHLAPSKTVQELILMESKKKVLCVE